MLHSTFWTHGAGDLDLPPWALPTQLPPRGGSSYPAKSRGQAGRHATIPTPPPDGPFLDFLYPPQALAWLHRASGHNLERWERRNARRLPEGFKAIRSSRGYSSQSYAPYGQDLAATQTPLGTEKEHQDTPPPDDGESTEDLGQESNTDQDSATESPNSPVKLELGPVEQRQQALHQLRQLLADRRSFGEEDVKLAWSLYTSLEDDDKSNPVLKKELLLWLHACKNPIASAHCISLYWSLPLDKRPLEVYRVTLDEFLNRCDWEFAGALHREALSTIPNGAQITKTLFQHALEISNWQLAVNTKVEHENHFSGPEQARHRAIFWFNVAETHNLVQVAHRLVISLATHGDEPLFSGIYDEALHLATRLAEESILKLARAPFTPNSVHALRTAPFPRTVQTLIQTLVERSKKAKEILEIAVTSILQHNVDREHYANAHLTVSNMYRAYRDLPGALPSEHLLQMFLERLQKHWGNPRYTVAPVGICLADIAEDWKKFHGRLNISTIEMLLKFYAAQGDAENVELYAQYAKTNNFAYEDLKEILWTLVYVHARRNDLENAARAFEDVQATAEAHDDTPHFRVWNSLFFAHCRADNLDGALELYKKFLAAGIIPDAATLHSISMLLARRGDIAGVNDMIRQFERFNPGKLNMNLIGSRLFALIKLGQVEEAEDALKHAVVEARSTLAQPPLTECCNIVLLGYAKRPDVGATMRIYGFMKMQNIHMNTLTYSAVMQALVSCRQTDAAKRILTHVLPREGLQPTPLHYAILITGYTHERNYVQAASISRKMLRDRIRPTIATKRAILKMRMSFERQLQQGRQKRTKGRFKRISGPLRSTAEIRESVESFDQFSMTLKGPRHGADSTAISTGMNEYIDSAMLYRSRNSLNAVEGMFRLYQEEVEKRGLPAGPPPMRVLEALMAAHFHAKKYDTVEMYWNIAKDKADRFAPSPMVPDFGLAVKKDDQNPGLPALSAAPRFETGSAEADKAEIGFSPSAKTNIQDARTTLLPKINRPHAPRPAPGRTLILTRAFRIYLSTLLKQRRISDMIKVATQLLSQGYRFDIITWNRLVEYLCVAPDPPVLLAFILAERYLMPGFPGWAVRISSIRPRRGANYHNFQFMKNRYENRYVLRPHYRTLLYLAKAFKTLQEAETVRGVQREEELRGLQKLRGSMRQIRERAPQTIAALETLPDSTDKWQERILRGAPWEYRDLEESRDREQFRDLERK